jgi:hypothetical protein
MGSTLNVSDRYGKTENKRREEKLRYHTKWKRVQNRTFYYIVN